MERISFRLWSLAGKVERRVERGLSPGAAGPSCGDGCCVMYQSRGRPRGAASSRAACTADRSTSERRAGTVSSPPVADLKAKALEHCFFLFYRRPLAKAAGQTAGTVAKGLSRAVGMEIWVNSGLLESAAAARITCSTPRAADYTVRRYLEGRAATEVRAVPDRLGLEHRGDIYPHRRGGREGAGPEGLGARARTPASVDRALAAREADPAPGHHGPTTARRWWRAAGGRYGTRWAAAADRAYEVTGRVRGRLR